MLASNTNESRTDPKKKKSLTFRVAVVNEVNVSCVIILQSYLLVEKGEDVSFVN